MKDPHDLQRKIGLPIFFLGIAICVAILPVWTRFSVSPLHRVAFAALLFIAELQVRRLWRLASTNGVSLKAASETQPHNKALRAMLSLRLNRAEVLILALSSVIAMTIFLVTDPMYFGDSNSYLLFSMAISEFIINPGVYMRQAGYPLLITATLYPWTLSLIGILAIQALCAALIPWYIYKLLRHISSPLAVTGALITIATLLPYHFQTLLFPDQTQLCLSILFCYLVVKYVFASNTKNMIAMFVAYACISFFRVTFLLLYGLMIPVVGTAAWQNRRGIRWSYYLTPFLALSIGVAGVHAASSALDAHLYANFLLKKPSLNGKMVFLNAFINSTGVEGAFLDGKYTHILRSKLVTFFREAPPEMRDVRNLRSYVADRFIQYQSDPEKMVDAILAYRTNHTWWLLFNISDRYFGDWGDPLFMRVALEQYRLHPAILWNSITNGLAYYLGVRACEAPFAGFPSEYECRFYPLTAPGSDNFGFPHFGPYTGMRAYTMRLVSPSVLATIGAPFIGYASRIWPSIYRATIPIGSFVTCIGLLCVLYRALSGRDLNAVRSDLQVLVVVLGVFLIYIAPMIILTDPEFRYVSAGVLFVVMSSLVSVRMMIYLSRPQDRRSATMWSKGVQHA
jgi:hypothetical protein